MLAIRLQRTGRKGHAQYKLIVQDARFSPKSGKVVNYLGDYNPHTKQANFNKELADKYLQNGAQPSDRVASILVASGVKLPKWYTASPKQQKSIKSPEKMRKNRPAGSPEPTKEEASSDEESPPEEAEPTSQTDIEKIEEAEPQSTNAEPEQAESPSEDTPEAKSEETSETSEQPSEK